MAAEEPPKRRRRRRPVDPDAPTPKKPKARTGKPDATDGVDSRAAAQAIASTPAPEPKPFSVTRPEHQSKFPQAPKLTSGFDTIARKLFAEGYDPASEWDRIKASLEIQGALTPEALRDAANQQEAIADRAFTLFVAAKRAHDAYMRKTEPIVSAIREAAIAQLEVEKRTLVEGDNGKKVPLRTKQITDADVTGMAATLYPDEWADVNDKRDRMHLMLKSVENLADLAKQKAATARTLLAPGRRSG